MIEYYKLTPAKDSLKEIRLEKGEEWRKRAIRADSMDAAESYIRDSIEDYLEENDERIVTDKWLDTLFAEDEELHHNIEEWEEEMKDRDEIYVNVGFKLAGASRWVESFITCPVEVNLAGCRIEPFCSLDMHVKDNSCVPQLIYKDGREAEVGDVALVYRYTLQGKDGKMRDGRDVMVYRMSPYLLPDVIKNDISEETLTFVHLHEGDSSLSFRDIWGNPVPNNLICSFVTTLLKYLPAIQDVNFFEAIINSKQANAVWKIIPDNIICCKEVYLSPPL